MKHLWVALFVFPAIASAEIGSLQVDQYCSFNDDPLPKQLITFSSDADAKAAISRIMQYTGLPPRFKILAADVPNAAAIIRGNQRYILYNQFFMSQIQNKTQNQWAQISILAHEIGHHLSSHTLEESGSRPRLELEADMFSGHVLQRMGASMEDAVAAMKQVADENGSRTHPPRRSRIAAIANGWKKAQEQNSGGQIITPIPFKREPTPQSTTSRGSVNHSHNGRSHNHPLPAEGTDHQHNGGTAASNPVPAPRRTIPTANLPSTINLANNLQLIRIPAGNFQMGTNEDTDLEKPAHKVTIPRPFWMSKTETTFAQYDAYATASDKPKPPDEGWGRGTRPVINVSWHDATAYAQWLSSNNKKNLQCRLPSEAEWEYSARAGTATNYPWGIKPTYNYANYGSDFTPALQKYLEEGKDLADLFEEQDDKDKVLIKGRDKWAYTAITGSFSTNQFGLNDMHGNVSEWTHGCWNTNGKDPDSPITKLAQSKGRCSFSALRGGDWSTSSDLESLSSSSASVMMDRFAYGNHIGFRIMCFP